MAAPLLQRLAISLVAGYDFSLIGENFTDLLTDVDRDARSRIFYVRKRVFGVL